MFPDLYDKNTCLNIPFNIFKRKELHLRFISRSIIFLFHIDRRKP